MFSIINYTSTLEDSLC